MRIEKICEIQTTMIMEKRKRASIQVVIEHSVAGGLIELPPTPGIETTKEFPLLANEIAMCMRIAYIYTEDQLTGKEVIKLLVEAGIAMINAAGVAYIAATVGKILVKEVLNFYPLAWWVKSLIGGSLTACVGLYFIQFCEMRFSEYPNASLSPS